MASTRIVEHHKFNTLKLDCIFINCRLFATVYGRISLCYYGHSSGRVLNCTGIGSEERGWVATTSTVRRQPLPLPPPRCLILLSCGWWSRRQGGFAPTQNGAHLLMMNTLLLQPRRRCMRVRLQQNKAAWSGGALFIGVVYLKGVFTLFATRIATHSPSPLSVPVPCRTGCYWIS